MSIEITMPRLSDTMEQGTIIKWNVKEGDYVSAGDAIADVETDKATMEMTVFDDGTIGKILIDEGQTVEVGTVIAVLAEDGEELAELTATAQADNTTAAEAPAPKGGPPVSRAARPALGDGRVRTSPLARRLAEEHGIDLDTIEGSGPNGRIVKRDVLRALEAGAETVAAVAPQPPGLVRAPSVPSAPPPPPSVAPLAALEERIVPVSSMRQTIARRLVESKQTIPHYQVTASFAMDELLKLRATLNEQLADQDVKLSVNDFILRACALAMHEHPEFNSSWQGDSIRIHGRVNLGLAIALPAERGGGLVVGTLRDTDQLTLRGISTESKRLAEKARARGLTVEEMADSTFVVSNLGMFGIEHFTAIINPPNTAILAVGAAIQKPVVRGGELTVGHEMQATLSLDHRVIDGAMGARYLQTLAQFLEHPATLLV
jgi:pyruvate dehydrogenase E2 component (dihydrolipoamide acetyltransferase)